MSTTGGRQIPPQQQTPSIRCSICRVAIFGEAHATKHATLTKHCEFEEFIPEPGEEVSSVDPEITKPQMSEEEKLAKIEELRKRNEILRKQKQEDQEKEEQERERKRRQDAKDAEGAKQRWKDEQERKQLLEQKREKEEAARQLEKVRLQIAEDKLKRELEVKSATALPVTTALPVSTALPQEPPKVIPKSTQQHDKCSLTIRLTNGSRIEAQFLPTDTLKTVVEYIKTHRTDGNRAFNIMMTRTVYKEEQYNSTLQELDLVPRALLTLTPK